jgi:hypothetical protein
LTVSSRRGKLSLEIDTSGRKTFALAFEGLGDLVSGEVSGCKDHW